MGGIGTGHVTKVLNNFLNGVTLAATAEVMVAGKKAGLDLAQLLDVINTSTGVSFASLNRFPHIIKGDYLEGGLTGRLMAKDVRLYLDLAEELGVVTLVGPGALATFQVAPPPGGQLLVVTAGRGVVATRDGGAQVVTSGDVVWAEPGEEHWHGACGDSLLTHMAVSHGATEWSGEVAEGDYTAAQP